MEKLNVISLFCGCGGMDLGLLGNFEYLGNKYSSNPFNIVYAVDFDEYCTKIYNENFKHKCEIKDVRNIDIAKLPSFDILIGGFPCQSFSISAQNPPRLGYKDERGMLFFEMVKILKERQPRAFIAENVKGILSANKGKAFPMIIKEFADAGYKVQFKLLIASDYGVPQKRERVIIVGFREEEDYKRFTFPSALPKARRKVLRDVIDEAANNDEHLFFSDKAVAGMMAVRDKMNKGRVMSLDEPCNTISSHLAKVSLNSTDPVYFIDGRYRRFSTKEAAAIQSFPAEFKFNSVSEGRQYKAIGNAVPPVMMWHVAQSVAKALNPHTAQLNVSVPALEELFPKATFLELDFNAVKEEYPEQIIENISTESLENLDKSKNVLVSYVKSKSAELYLDGGAKIYYTGKKFPSTVALNKLYYFIPYLKNKGIRDLYLIKIARVGSKSEVVPDADPNDLRLVFEIEYIQQLFPDYKPHKLRIWDTFTNTTLESILTEYKYKIL